jgi:hypothetical protein
MRHVQKNKFLLAAGFLSAALAAIGLSPVFAATATLYVTPASGSVINGNNLTFSIRVNTGGDTVNVVRAKLTYPADKFDFVSINTSGSAFDIQAANTGGGGNINIERAAAPGKSGDLLIASITLRAKVSSGSGTVSFASDSAVVRESDSVNIVGPMNGGTYTFAAPPTPPPTPTPTPTPSPSPSPTPNPNPSTRPSPSPTPSTTSTPTSPEKDVTAPTITSGPSVTSTSQTGAVIEWETSEDTTSTVEYGLSDQYELTAGDNTLTKAHKVVVNSTQIVAGVEYKFRVKSTDAGGNGVVSEGHTFRTSGVQITIKLKKSDGSAVSNVGVIVDGKTVKTNDFGDALFNDMAVGKHDVRLDRRATLNPASIVIDQPDENTELDVPQTFEITVEKMTSLSIKWLLLTLLLLVIFTGGGGTWLYLGKPDISAFLNRPKGSSKVAESIVSAASTSAKEQMVKPIDVIPHPEVPKPGHTITPSGTS